MPLRDHFRPPLDNIVSWEGFHGQWPANIVKQLRQLLPVGYTAAPRVHLGSQVEIDLAAFETEDVGSVGAAAAGDGGVATAVWAPAAPSVAVEAPLPDYDEYEVRVYDAKRSHRLVAVIGNRWPPEQGSAREPQRICRQVRGVAPAGGSGQPC